MKNWEEISKKNFKFIRTLVLRGIPGPMRGMAWQLLAGSQSMSLKSQYPSLITVRGTKLVQYSTVLLITVYYQLVLVYIIIVLLGEYTF